MGEGETHLKSREWILLALFVSCLLVIVLFALLQDRVYLVRPHERTDPICGGKLESRLRKTDLSL